MLVVTAEASERNKGPILEVLQQEFAASRSVLEIGSGTGQHAVHFAAHLPQLSWQPSEVTALLPALAERIRVAAAANLSEPLALDVREVPWPVAQVDAIFSANTLHIMGWSAVQDFFPPELFNRIDRVVAFAPLKPAEFVIIKIAQLAGQTQTS